MCRKAEFTGCNPLGYSVAGFTAQDILYKPQVKLGGRALRGFAAAYVVGRNTAHELHGFIGLRACALIAGEQEYVAVRVIIDDYGAAQIIEPVFVAAVAVRPGGYFGSLEQHVVAVLHELRRAIALFNVQAPLGVEVCSGR